MADSHIIEFLLGVILMGISAWIGSISKRVHGLERSTVSRSDYKDAEAAMRELVTGHQEAIDRRLERLERILMAPSRRNIEDSR